MNTIKDIGCGGILLAILFGMIGGCTVLVLSPSDTSKPHLGTCSIGYGDCD